MLHSILSTFFLLLGLFWVVPLVELLSGVCHAGNFVELCFRIWNEVQKWVYLKCSFLI